ncbi:MAG: type II toxin-antitoxin system mRNA interferase toxin, RelE/StbE family [Gammaproteobacteria bacterium CG11_big_fil_rev_8_21_14_0_20_46_22]|nr:MAG: type II toxin-antitoxin system mRNA interferase toxin, RelE/StbE family [Gammaproteobacteria bacterium CG12_big_fil_rev_8_21_14_0_65_46_12]PIR10140.1 MAG: type II toxin-antitoxin system mRNA interferase toxin, RelE/StbE family [Gammaproteobacteria bacterium CG11_big_fil_rev_8_21_14_0_20_46_22]
MWEVLEQKNLGKTLKKVPREILKRFEVWKRIVELQGPEGLKAIKGFHDEALKGNLKGLRSSRLSIQWRVTYKLEKNVYKVYVVEIHPHDY